MLLLLLLDTFSLEQAEPVDGVGDMVFTTEDDEALEFVAFFPFGFSN